MGKFFQVLLNGRTITSRTHPQPRTKVSNPQAFLLGLVAYGENLSLDTLMKKINMGLISETVKKRSIYVILGI